jgi:hypothetical protein
MGLLYAIILIIIIGLAGTLLASFTTIPLIGLLTTLSLALIIAFPVGIFLLSILSSFILALIYNLIVPRLGGIKLKIDGDKVTKIPVIPISLNLSAIYAIMSFIFMLVFAPMLAVLLQLSELTSATSMMGISGIGLIGALGSIILIIGTPIVVFVVMFIIIVLSALFYNLLAPSIGGVRLVFKNVEDKVFEIKEIPPIALALITAVVLTIVNFIFSLPTLAVYILAGDFVGAVGYLIGTIIGNLIFAFITYAIIALLYNFLRTKIGGIKLELD